MYHCNSTELMKEKIFKSVKHSSNKNILCQKRKKNNSYAHNELLKTTCIYKN